MSGFPPRWTERVLHLGALSVPIHIYEAEHWDGRIDDKIEGDRETAVVHLHENPDVRFGVGAWQVWVDGQNVAYEHSERAAIAAIRRHRDEYEPTQWGNGMAPSNWTQESMEGLRRLSLEAVRMSTKHAGVWTTPFSELRSDVCYRPEMIHDLTRGWWELRFPRGGAADGEIITFFRRSQAEAAATLCGNWLDEISQLSDDNGRAITERILFLDMIRDAAVGTEDESHAAAGPTEPGVSGELVTRRELSRQRFLLESYSQAEGDTMKLVDGNVVAETMGLTGAEGRITANYLEEHGLIREQGTHMLITLTAKGVDEAERRLRATSASAQDRGPRTVDYDVALSFAGEQRAFVEEVAAGLQARGVAVFYDAFEVVYLWGKNLYDHLADLYENKAKYVVLFASAEYAEKAWTNAERKAAQARALREKGEYILPARFDDTPIPGIQGTVAYVDLRQMTPAQLVEIIVKKVT